MKASSPIVIQTPPDIAFVVAAGRSGSTLIYKTLCLHPEICYINNVVTAMPGWPVLSLLNRLARKHVALKTRAWFEDSGQAHGVQRDYLRKLVPMPREGESFYNKAGIPCFPPDGFALSEPDLRKVRRHFAKLLHYGGGKLVLSKRIANNRRLPLLKAAFPDARFIHLVRDGRAVLYSLLNSPRVQWRDEWAAQMNLPSADFDDPRTLTAAAHGWLNSVQRVEAALADVDESRIHRLRYEAFLTDPVAATQAMTDFLSLGPSQAHLDAVRSVIVSAGGGGWRKGWTAEQLAVIEGVQGDALTRYGYELQSRPPTRHASQ
ncbi:MAG: sulfotransferase [Thiohalocapsa sp.]|nr:sulfotransferase [Thiohalocapsa sp.]MCF7989424.1 sulfotransferase [Thiohalocapsa sp.]